MTVLNVGFYPPVGFMEYPEHNNLYLVTWKMLLTSCRSASVLTGSYAP